MPYFECPICLDGKEYYGDKEDFYEHLDAYNHWLECETCDRQFSSQHSQEQHMNAMDHWAPVFVFECETCDREFLNRRSLAQHMNALDHWAPEFDCETCNMTFSTSSAAEQHMSRNAHYRYYCQPCDRRFENANNLKMHLNSRLHRGENVKCPFCQVGFVTASGASHHLESGSCPRAKGLNRESMYRIIQGADRNAQITSKQLKWYGETNSEYTVTRTAWNGNCWECYLCHKGFSSGRALSQHLDSPVHQQEIYHCPNSKCSKQFVSLAGLFNHLESESCKFIRFENVQQAHSQVADAMIRGGRLLAFN